MERLRSRRLLAVVAGMVLVLLAGLAWLYRLGYFGGSAFDLGARLPASSRAAWMVHLRGQVDYRAWGQDLRELSEKLPASQRQRLFPGGASSSGEFLRFTDGRMGGALLEGKASVGLMGVRDKAGLETLLESKAVAGASPELLEGLSFRYLSGGWLAAQDGSWLYLSNSAEGARALVGSVAGRQALGERADFQEGRGKVEGRGALFAAYLNLDALLGDLKTVPVEGTDAGTWEGLAGLRYGVVSVSFQEQQSQAFLKVADDGSSLSRALLTPGGLDATAFGAYSSNVPAAHALDLKWSFQTALALASLSPRTRTQAGLLTAGAMMANPFAALEGDLALASDWPSTLGPDLASRLLGSPPVAKSVSTSLTLSAALKDVPLTRALLEKVLTPSPNGASGQQTVYATPFGSLLLEAGPPGRLSLSFGKASIWKGQGASVGGRDELVRALEWGGQGIVYADDLDLGPLLDGFEAGLGSDGSPEADFGRTLVGKMRGWPLRGASCLAVQQDGLAWRSQGPGGLGLAVLLGMAGKAAGAF